MSAARFRIHAMFQLDEQAETELDLRLDAHEAEVTRANAALIEDRACDADFTEDPQFITGLREAVELLTRAAREGAATPTTNTPVFFQRGHIYIREHHGVRVEFRVTGVDTSPDGRLTVAHGWRSDPYEGWARFDSDDLTGWTDVTEADSR